MASMRDGCKNRRMSFGADYLGSQTHGDSQTTKRKRNKVTIASEKPREPLLADAVFKTIIQEDDSIQIYCSNGVPPTAVHLSLKYSEFAQVRARNTPGHPEEPPTVDLKRIEVRKTLKKLSRTGVTGNIVQTLS